MGVGRGPGARLIGHACKEQAGIHRAVATSQESVPVTANCQKQSDVAPLPLVSTSHGMDGYTGHLDVVPAFLAAVFLSPIVQLFR